MRWAKRGLVVLSTLLCLVAAYSWIVSTYGAEVVHWASATDAQKVIRTFYVTERRMSYRWQSSPDSAASMAPGLYYYQIVGGPVQADNPPYHGFMGFEYIDARVFDETSDDPSVRVVRMSVPIWLPLIIFGIAPAYWITHHHRYPKGCCQSCGYDLCETPDRCPECGEVPREAETIT